MAAASKPKPKGKGKKSRSPPKKGGKKEEGQAMQQAVHEYCYASSSKIFRSGLSDTDPENFNMYILKNERLWYIQVLI